MKNYVVKAGIGVAVFLLVCIGSIQIYTKYQGKKAEEEKPISLKSSSETFSKESSEQSEKEQISQQDYDTFLQDFGEKFLNYSSIDERNKSVRDMFTGEARAINGLDTSVDINVEEKWQNLQIAIYPKGYSKDTLTNEQKFHFVHKELSDKELPAKDKSKEDYEIDFLKFQLKETRQAQEKNKKEQQRLSEDVEKLNQITNDLEDTLKDKTDSEKQELQQTISQNKSKKEELQKTVV